MTRLSGPNTHVRRRGWLVGLSNNGAGAIVALVLAWLWICSLALPVAVVNRSLAGFPGWIILLFGWSGLWAGQFGWLANIAFWASFLALLAPRPMRTLGFVLAAVLVATTCDALFWREIDLQFGPAPILAFGAGYFLWIATMIAAATAMVLRSLAAGPDRDPEPLLRTGPQTRRPTPARDRELL